MAAIIRNLIEKLPDKAASDPKVQDFFRQIEEGYYRPISMSLVGKNQLAGQSIAKTEPLIGQTMYYLYGVNLITLGFLKPPISTIPPKKFQFLDKNQTSIFISPEVFQDLDKEVEYRSNLAILVGMTCPPRRLSAAEEKIVADLHLKKCEVEYAKGLELIKSGSDVDMSLEKFELLDEKCQKKLATLIGRRFLLKTLSGNDQILLDTSVEVVSVKQEVKAQCASPGSKASFFPEIPSADSQFPKLEQVKTAQTNSP